MTRAPRVKRAVSRVMVRASPIGRHVGTMVKSLLWRPVLRQPRNPSSTATSRASRIQNWRQSCPRQYLLVRLVGSTRRQEGRSGVAAHAPHCRRHRERVDRSDLRFDLGGASVHCQCCPRKRHRGNGGAILRSCRCPLCPTAFAQRSATCRYTRARSPHL